MSRTRRSATSNRCSWTIRADCAPWSYAVVSCSSATSSCLPATSPTWKTTFRCGSTSATRSSTSFGSMRSRRRRNTMDLAELRGSIAATRDVIYLNTGFTGPSPQPVLDAINGLLQREASVGPASVEGLRLRGEAGSSAQAAVAELLHVDPDEVIRTHGTTEGVHVVLHG